MATITPEYFETTLAADLTAPAAGTSQTITVANGNAVPEVTGSDWVWAWLGNNNVEASLEAVKITAHVAASTSVTVTRGANNGNTGTVVTHAEGDGFFGPALVSDVVDELTVAATGLASHLADAADAHDASAISVTPVGAIAATDVQAALAELDTEKATAASVTAHTGDTTDAHAATAISFTPAGTIAATTVQAAIEEVAAEAAGGAGTVVVEEVDGAPTASFDTIIFPNGTLTDNADGSVTYTPAGGGGISDHDHSAPTTQGGTALTPALLTVNGLTELAGVLTPAQITADQNNYFPLGADDANVLLLSTDASRNITGIGTHSYGMTLLVWNTGAFDIVLVDESASSTAANRFALDADMTIAPGKGALLWYDDDNTRWRGGLLGAASGGGGGSVATDAIWDAAGDLAVGSGANTAARLAIGTEGQVPRVSSGGTLEYAGGMTRLATTTVGAGGAASIDFTGISGNYTHLLVVLAARGDVVAVNCNLYLRFNADATAIYDDAYFQTYTTSALAVANAQTRGGCGSVPGASATAGLGTGVEIRIPFYADTNWQRSWLSESAPKYSNTDIRTWRQHGGWRSTAAVTQVTIYPVSGNFVQYSRADLYGVK